MLEIGSLVDGKYKVLNVVGKGGMSVVYLVMNERANKQWAIKEVRKDGVQDFEVVKQNLIVETDMLKNLNHPNLPSIIDVIDTEESFLIVMDYIEGKALDKVLIEFGAQPQEYVIEWAKQLCDVLGYLHSRKPPIIYRDMKPANVMLKPDGNVTLIDFGTAREFKDSKIEDTTCLGTRGYAAPEQYGGRGQTDARTDIYCLGATLYHLVTGHNPSQPPYEMHPIRYWNANLSSGLEEIILKCTRPNPAERYQNCQELQYALEHYEELDEEYHKAQKSKLRVFLVVSLFVFLFGMGSLFCNVRENILTSQSYDSLIEQAKSAEMLDDQKKYYSNAVELDPENEEAYLSMLTAMTEDEEFSSEEASIVQSILYTKHGSVDNLTYLKKNKKGFADFAYNLGIDYFFKFKGTEGKNNSKLWFDYAQDSGDGYLSKSQLKRAEIYSRIGSYYLALGKEDKSGETGTATYANYFSDLTELNQYEPSQMDNTVTAITLYCEIASQIGDKANDFLINGDGISEEQLMNELDKIQNRIESLSASGEENIEKLQTNLQEARMKVSSASGQHDRLTSEIIDIKVDGE